jgi:hypothetical protein
VGSEGRIAENIEDCSGLGRRPDGRGSMQRQTEGKKLIWRLKREKKKKNLESG